MADETRRESEGKKRSTRSSSKGTSRKKKPAEKTQDCSVPEAEEFRERLHKFLASTGAGSRRECETFIAQGRVSVNGKVVTKMGVKVDPTSDVVALDGERVKPEARVYYLLNKPAGYICTNADERGRPRAVELIQDKRRIYTVGRLDADSTGLVLLTNDGGIANVVCHPRYRIEKCYQVHVRGEVTRDRIAQVEAGVWLAEGKSSPATVKPIGRNPKRGETILEMTLFEGRNREIRRVFAKVGLNVRRLQRTSIGPLVLGELPPAAYRRLSTDDLSFVHEAETMYRANREAWDAELPTEERRRPRRPQPIGGDRQGGGRGQGRRGGQGGDRNTLGGAQFPKRGRRSSSRDERGDGPDSGPPQRRRRPTIR